MNGVFTNDLRVEFVDGEVTAGTPATGYVACGPGTAFAIEGTLLQFDELLYRVRDAYLTSGQIDIVMDGVPMSLSSPTSALTNRYTTTPSGAFQKRGYTKQGTETYNGEVYDPGDTTEWSDIGDNENGLWQTTWNTQNATFIDAFKYETSDVLGIYTSTTGWFNVDVPNIGVIAEVIRGYRIAVVRVNPADGFYASTNRFFLELEFWFAVNDNVPAFTAVASTNCSSSGAHGVFDDDYPVGNYVIRLNTGDLSCPIYLDDVPPDITASAVSDIIHEAKTWVEYGKNSPVEPVWDNYTGNLL